LFRMMYSTGKKVAVLNDDTNTNTFKVYDSVP
jgi:hypothetical protein